MAAGAGSLGAKAVYGRRGRTSAGRPGKTEPTSGGRVEPKPRIEVRKGRRGRELRIDGTFASWYDPALPVTGSVWDALAVPLLALPPRRRRSVLVVGLGGGSVARVIRALAPGARIVGVEYSRDVLAAARRWLDLDALGLEVVVGDAHRYLARSRRRFDLVVEDVFVGRGRNVHKPDWFPEPGLGLAAARLAPGGLLVSNTIDEFPAMSRALRRLCRTRVCIGVEDFDNRVLVGGGAALSARSLRAAVRREPILAATLPRLSFRTLR